MSFLNRIKQSITGVMPDIKTPIFYKEFIQQSQHLNQLKNILNTNPQAKKSLLETDIKLTEIGLYGESSVKFEIETSNIPCLVLHDLNLPLINNTFAQSDFVVITQKYILVIECKNLYGDIEINSRGDFNRLLKSKTGQIEKVGTYNPLTQNQRHVNSICTILENEFKMKKPLLERFVKQIVVFANDKTVIHTDQAPPEIMQYIIKHDRLIAKMKEYTQEQKDDCICSQQFLYKIADRLKELHTPKIVDYTKYIDSTQLKNNYKAIQPSLTSVQKQEYKSETQKQTENTNPIYVAIRNWRYQQSKAENIQPYLIFNNITLDELVQKKPKTMQELEPIQGLGDVKIQKYGQALLKIIAEKQSIESVSTNNIQCTKQDKADIQKQTENTNLLYVAIRNWRYQQSKAENIQAYLIFNNATLDQLVQKKPRTTQELKEIQGLSDVKIQKYSVPLLKIITQN